MRHSASFVLFCFPSWETILHRTKPIGSGFKHQQHFYLGLAVSAVSGRAFVSLVIAIPPPLAFQRLSPWGLQWDVGTLVCALWSSPHYKAHCAISFKVSLSAKKDTRRLTLRLAIQPLEGLEASWAPNGAAAWPGPLMETAYILITIINLKILM